MHMADALISPAVGGTLLVAAAGITGFSIKKIQTDMDNKKIPLMGVMGAFIFASQMINFSIPGTGSSGHLAGGVLLAALLGPAAGFLTMACVLLIQALFFGDGGLLAFGCNVINLGFFSCFIAYPFIYKKILYKGVTVSRLVTASVISAVLGLQMGSFGVVLETLLSGKTELPFGTFVVMMQPIHLAIGIVEGIVTSVVLTFLWKARPELVDHAALAVERDTGKTSRGKILAVLLGTAILIGGGLSWFASANPDGLEWAMEKVAGTAELESSGKIHEFLADIQDKIALLPDYSFKTAQTDPHATGDTWPAVSSGTSVSGITGGALTLLLIVGIGLVIRAVKRKKRKQLDKGGPVV